MKLFCEYFDQGICKSCTLIETDYSLQLKSKEEKLINSLKDFQIPDLLPSIESDKSGFRNKAKLTITGTLENPIIGLLGEEKMDMGREILSCPLHHSFVNKLVASLPKFIQLAKIPPYNISGKKGEIKGVIIYYSERSHESYLRLVLRSKESIDRIRKHLNVLESQFKELKCISANIQPIPHAILEGEEEIILSENKNINHQLLHISMKLGPKGFVQTNQKVAERLYNTAAEWVNELKLKKFAELFSGQGAFSFFVAPLVHEAIGFEIDPEAVYEANQTAQILGCQHLHFDCGDAGDMKEKITLFKPDVILVNPPRRGLGESLSYLKEGITPYLLYSSCNVETLSRDLEELSKLYEIERLQLFDMFPHTKHFETLVLLHLRK